MIYKHPKFNLYIQILHRENLTKLTYIDNNKQQYEGIFLSNYPIKNSSFENYVISIYFTKITQINMNMNVNLNQMYKELDTVYKNMFDELREIRYKNILY
jgi:hypothetical protein